ncbi:MAG: cysteine desulfurase family protein [bacterium]
MDRIYLDHNATTPLHPDVLESMLPYLRDQFGNPSSIHWYGQKARRALDTARQQVARLINAEPEEIVFLSGGTESTNLAIRGVLDAAGLAAPRRRPAIVTSAVEHQAVLNCCRDRERHGALVTYLDVDSHGRVDLERAADAITSDTTLVTVMLANNDVGTLQPVRELTALAQASAALTHTDAVQALGKIPVSVGQLGVDLLSLSGHKIYGPKGIGALYVRKSTRIHALLHGGHQERRRRAGTENVPAIVGLGRACDLASTGLGVEADRQAALRDRLERTLRERLPGVTVNGHPALRLPNTLHVSFDGVQGEALLINLDLMGVAVSTGAACSSGSEDPSHVLTAMGLDERQARGSIRLSLGRDTTGAQIDRTVELVTNAVTALRQAEHHDG